MDTAMPGTLPEALLAWTPLWRIRNAIARDVGRPGELLALVRRRQPRDQPAAEVTLASQVAGRTVLITGGSSGIGLATARRVAAAGATTLICGRDRGKLEEARRQIEGAGGTVATHQVNLADLDQCDRFLETVRRDHGGVDILVNNAGRSIRRTVEDSLDRFHDFQRTMQLNYFGALRLTMGLLPEMARRGRGQVINVSSVGVLTRAPRFSAYVASKAALDAWTDSAASEYAGRGVTFTTINMPLVKTPMIAPVGGYDGVPTLSADQAADLIVHAILHRPLRIATRTGLLSEALHLLLPRAGRLLMHAVFCAAAPGVG
jgi:NAD(P)-dependent dehydrogenase (short-subunit alcohol dehydrogenase family)